MQQQQQGSDWVGEWKRQFNLLQALMQIAAFPVEIITTRFGTWGSRYLNVSAVFGMVWPVLFGSLCGPHHRIYDLFYFWIGCFALLLVHRVAGIARRNRGEECHSKYWGTSWLARGTSLKAQRQARTLDSLIVCGIGYILVQLGSVPLAGFLIISAVAKLMSDLFEFQASHARLQNMRDARIENSFYIDEFREQQR